MVSGGREDEDEEEEEEEAEELLLSRSGLGTSSGCLLRTWLFSPVRLFAAKSLQRVHLNSRGGKSGADGVAFSFCFLFPCHCHSSSLLLSFVSSFSFPFSCFLHVAVWLERLLGLSNSFPHFWHMFGCTLVMWPFNPFSLLHFFAQFMHSKSLIFSASLRSSSSNLACSLLWIAVLHSSR